MGATLIVDDPELAPVLSGAHLPTSEGWKAELAYRREEVGRSVGMTSTGNQSQIPRMIAQLFTHYATAAIFFFFQKWYGIIKRIWGSQKVQWNTKNYMQNYQNMPFNPNSKCDLLCLNEKYEIATYKGGNLLNKRTEIINTWIHK